MGYSVASLVGDMAFLFWGEGRRNTTANMRQVLGAGGDEAQARRLAREAMRQYMKTLADFLCLPRLTGREIERLVVFDRWDLFDRALSYGKGVVFATLHMGSWDMGGAAMGNRGLTFSVLTDVFKTSALNERVVQARRDKGFNIVPAGRVPKAAVSALRKKQILGVLIDRPVTNGVTVRFFGAPCTLPAGMATLALRTGAVILPGCLLRDANDAFRGVALDPIIPNPTGRFEEDVQNLTQEVVDALESIIRLDPGQWFAFRPMWPGRASGGVQPPQDTTNAVLDPC